MKTTKKQGLTASQKRYLRQQIIQYHLNVVLVHARQRRLKAKPQPKKPRRHLEHTANIPAAATTPEQLAAKPAPRKLLGWRRMALAGTGILLLVVAVQVFYPENRALPLSRLETAGYMGFADKNAILQNFEDFDQRIVTVHTHSKTVTTSYKDLGITINPEETVEKMTDYPLSERLVPFSALVKGNKNHAIERSLDEAQLEFFVKNIIAQSSEQPVDALVKLQGTKFEVTDSKNGYEYDASVLRSRILAADLADRGQVIFTPTILRAAISTEQAEAVAARMQQRIDNPLAIVAEAKIFRIEPAVMASWVDIAHKPNENRVDIYFNKARVDATLRPFVAEVDYPAVPTVTTLLNGMQAGQLEGSSGRSLQYDNLLERVVANTSPVTSDIRANVVVVPPPQETVRKYTRDSQGLQSLLQYWTSINSGTYSIDVRSLNGRMSANINPHQLTPSIGIYRLYIASMVYGRVAAGSTQLGAVTQTGQTVEVCLDRMLRESEDGCTYALGSLVGWGSVDSLLRAQGFDNTTLAENNGLTTANDMTDWFLKLESGNITRFEHTTSIVNSLSQQVYRGGIPAGAPDVLVANKFGSYGRYTHDVGMIYHPNGAYVLSILSEGGRASQIADLSREIFAVMSQ